MLGHGAPGSGAVARGLVSSSNVLLQYTRAGVVVDILEGRVPSEALVEEHCWKTICRVRARNLGQIDAITWARLCTRRGYVQKRKNPRGF